MKDRYPFPLPKQVVDHLNGLYVPVWKRYGDYSWEMDDTYPTALHALNGWRNIFKELMVIQHDWYDPGRTVLEEENKKAGFQAILDMMVRDLADILDFAQRTLPLDPWIHAHMRDALQEFPEFFEEPPDAALPVPPEDAAAMQ